MHGKAISAEAMKRKLEKRQGNIATRNSDEAYEFKKCGKENEK